MKSYLVGLFILAASLGGARAQSWVAGSPPNDSVATTYFPYLSTKISSLAYGTASSSEVGDIYLPNYNGKPTPANSTSRPAVIVVHGGGGTSGSRASTREIQTSQLLAAHGYVAFNIDYRIGSIYPKNIQDWRLAVRYLRANAATYGIDPNHIGITGGSFGGFCSAFMSGITNGQRTIWPDSNASYNNISLDTDGQGHPELYSGDVQCAFDMYGPVDQVTSGNAAGQYSSPTSTTLSNSSSIYYVHASSAPLMIAHGSSDTTVNTSQSREMTNHLGQFHVPYFYAQIPGGQHTFNIYDTSKGGTWPLNGTSGTIDLRKDAMDWFDKWLLASANPPLVSVQPTPQSGCSGYSASFSVTASGTAPLRYQWSGPSGAIANATNTTYTIASLTGANAGNYSVIITNNYGSVTSSVVALTVNTATPPGITTQPTNQAVLAGNAVSLTVGATGDALQYQWSGPSGVIASATNATYSISSAANSDAGTYQVVVFNSCNSLASSNATLTVNGPPNLTGQPLDVITCSGTSASLVASAGGTDPLSYQWYGPAGAIAGASTNNLTVTNLSVGDSGNYYLVVTNAYGSATSSNALLTVSANSNVTITSQPTNFEVAVGGPATFSVSVTGGGPYTYLWLRNDYDTILDAVYTNATLVFTNVTAADAGYYHCFINNDCYTASTTNATLTVDVAPTITQQPLSSTNNVNATVTLSVGANGTAPITYQWRTNGVNLANATNTTLTFNSIQSVNAGAYTVVVANSFGSVTSIVANVTVNVSITGSVTANSAASVQSAANAAVDIDEQTAGYVKVKFATVGGTGTGMAKGYYAFDLTGQNVDTNKSATLTVPTVSASGATHIQVWGLLQAYPGMNSHITWNTAQANDTTTNGLLTSGSFTAAMIGTNTAASGSGANGVFTLPAPWGQFVQGNKLVLVLTPANPTGDSSSGYRPNVTNLPALTFSTAGAVTTPIISTQPGSQAVCSNTPVNFTVVSGGAQPLSYQWQFGGVNIDSGVNSTATNATLSLSNPSPGNNGNYQVVITNVYGAVTSSVASLTVSADPPVTIAAQPTNTSGVVGGSASFTVVANGGTLTYQWYQGASPVLNGTNATLNLSGLAAGNAGSYSVAINNSCGNASSQPATLTVNIPPGISQNPQNQTVVSGSTASFSVTAIGTTPLAYQWRRGGVVIGGANSSTYNLSGVLTNDSGSAFDVVITNNYGAITSSIAMLTVTVGSPELLSIEAGKAVYYIQTNSTGPVPLTGVNLHSWFGEVQGILPALITNATVSFNGTNTPNPYTIAAIDNTDLAQSEVFFSSYTALDAAFNNGNYHYVVKFASGTSYTADIPLGYNGTNDDYPNNPTLTAPAGDWTAGKLTLHAVPGGYQMAWGALTPAQTNDQIGIAITDTASGILVTELTIAGSITNYVLPGSLVDPNKDYGIDLTFTHMSYSSTNAGGIILYGLFEKISTFTIHTDSAGVASGVPASNRATVRDGVNTLVDIDEQTPGYVLTKYSTTGSSAKSYLQFDLTGTNADTSSPATLRVFRGSGGGAQRIQLWALNQAFNAPTNFNNINWVQAPANDTNSNSLLTSGPATATLLADLQASGSSNEIVIPAPWGQFVISNKLTLALTASIAIAGDVNSSAGYRVMVTNAAQLPTLRFALQTGPTLTQFYGLYDAGPGFFGGENLITTNTQGVAMFVWSSANPVSSVTNWTLEAQMGEQPLNDGSGNSRYSINVTPTTSPVYYLAGPLRTGPYVPTAPVEWITTNISYTVVNTNVSISAEGILGFPAPGNPPVVTSQPSPRSVLVGQTVAFSVTATGTDPLSYQWQRNNVNLSNGGVVSGANTNTLTLTGVGTNNAGNYSVVITNAAGTTNSSAAALTVSLRPNLGLISIGPDSVLLSANTVTGLTYVVENATNLSPPVIWLPVVTNVVPPSGQVSFTNSTTGAEHYFRLSFP